MHRLSLFALVCVACTENPLAAQAVDPPPGATSVEVVRIEYAIFPIRPQEGDVDPEEVRLWMQDNPEELAEELAAGMQHFVHVPPMVRARHLLAAGDDAEARRRAARWIERLHAGERFEHLARTESDDHDNGRRGGDLGYSCRGRLDEDLEAAIFDAPVGLLATPVRTRYGYSAVEVLGRREGDVPLEEARWEVATQIVRWDRAAERAREQAQEAAHVWASDGDLPASLADGLGDPVPTVEQSAPFLIDQPAFLFDDGSVSRAAFSLDDNSFAVVELDGGSFVVARLLERRSLAPGEAPPRSPAFGGGASPEELMAQLLRRNEIFPTIGYRSPPARPL